MHTLGQLSGCGFPGKKKNKCGNIIELKIRIYVYHEAKPGSNLYFKPLV